MSRTYLFRIASVLAVAGTFHFVGEVAGMRTLGVLVAGHAVALLFNRRMPYGWEGNTPSGFITGMPVKLIAVAMGVLSFTMLIRPQLMLALFGWDQ